MEIIDPENVSRAALTTVALYTAALALFAWRMPIRARVWGVLCAVAVAAYALCTASGTPGGIDNWATVLRLPILFFCAALPAVFWAFVVVLFDDANDNDRWRLMVVLMIGLLGLIAGGLPAEAGTISGAVAVLRRTLAIGLIVWSLWLLWRGKRTDLVDARVSTRMALLTVAGIYLLGVLIVELFVQGPAVSSALLAGNLTLIALITMALGVSMARWDLTARVDETTTGLRTGTDTDLDQADLSATPEKPRPTPDTAQDAIIFRLQHAMQTDQLYRREKLSIAALAKELGSTEHRLRSTINQRLGFRNFNDFLHHYRLTEAAERLADPTQAGVPVLTIALEVGYASIGPFNRAFKERFAQTPTAYRQQRLATGSMQ